MLFHEVNCINFTKVQKRKYISNLLLTKHATVIDLREHATDDFTLLSNWVSFPVDLNDVATNASIAQLKRKLVSYINSRQSDKTLVLICNDGGVISKVIWEILRMEFDTYIYKGGFRQLKKTVRQVFDLNYNLIRVAGPTGSGKTEILQELEKNGVPCINLEVLALHAGSVFGNIENRIQPTPFEFEYQLALSLKEKNPSWPIVLEDEQANLGQVNIPQSFWTQMQKATCIYIHMTEHARVTRLVDSYAEVNDQSIEDGILRLKPKLGKTITEELILALRKKRYAEVAKALIAYYDRTPGYAHTEPSKNDIVIKSDDIAEITNRIVDYIKRKSPSEPGALTL